MFQLAQFLLPLRRGGFERAGSKERPDGRVEEVLCNGAIHHVGLLVHNAAASSEEEELRGGDEENEVLRSQEI